MNKGVILLICLSIVWCIFGVEHAWAESEKKAVRDGNRLFREEKYDEALERYNEAQVAEPDSDIIAFNMGTAYYKKGEYDKAVESFTKALITDDPRLEARANYNIANAKYKQGRRKENTDLAQAIALSREALSYYKRAIEIDQSDNDAKFNHEFVEKKLKILLDKLKQMQEQMKDQQSGEQQEGEQQQSTQAVPSQGEQGEEQEAGEKSAQEQQEGEEQTGEEGQEKADIAGEEEQQEGQDQQTSQGAEDKQGDEMSEEEARMLLEGYRQEEEAGQFLNQAGQKGRYREVMKDW